MPELNNLRTINCKTFDMGGGKHRTHVHVGPIHCPDDPAAWKRGDPVTWEEPDRSYESRTNDLKNRKDWHDLRISKNFIGYDYISRMDGSGCRVELIEADGVAPTNRVPEVDAKNNVKWMNVRPDLDILLRVKPGRVDLFKRLKTPTAAKRLLWRVTESVGSTIRVNFETKGIDNYNLSDASREGTGVGNRRRELEMLPPVISPPDTTTRPGWSIRTVLEEWTGNTLEVDRATRIKTISSDVSYPVLIDQDITENIAADSDDGDELTTATDSDWNDEYQTTGNHIIYDRGSIYHSPAWRFTGITINAGVTIDDAHLKFVIASAQGSSDEPDTFVHADDVDSSAPFMKGPPDHSGPATRTSTTANTAFPTWGGGGATGAQDLTVTSIIQEIVDRGAWASGNDMSLWAKYTPIGNNPYSYIEDFSGSGTPASLEIDWTAVPVLTEITLDADGTIDTSDIEHDAGTGSPYFTHCNDANDGVSSDFVQNLPDADGTYVAWFRLADVDSDFSSMATLNLGIDSDANAFSNDLCTLTARIFAADNDTGTPLTDETPLIIDETNTTRTQQLVGFTGLTGTKAQWDGAYIRFSWVYDRVAGGDDGKLRIYGIEINGTYIAVGALIGPPLLHSFAVTRAANY